MTGSAANARDRRATRRLLLSSGLVDAEWLGLQLGRRLSPKAAAEAWAELPPGSGISPHPLFLPQLIPPGLAPRPDGLDALSWYLGEPLLHDAVVPHPLIDLDALRASVSVADGSVPLVAWLAAAGDATLLPGRPGHHPLSWGRVREVSYAALGRWRDGTHLGTLPDPVVQAATPVVSVVHPPRRGLLGTLRQTGFLRDEGADDDRVEHLVVLRAPAPQLYVGTVIAHEAMPSLRPVVTDTATPASSAAAIEAAVAAAHAGLVVLTLGPAPLPTDDLLALAAASEGRVGVPVLLDEAGLVVAGGALALDGVVTPLLADHHPDDLPAEPFEVPLALGEVVALPRSLWPAALPDGIGPEGLATELARYARAHGAATVVVPSVRLTASTAPAEGVAAGRLSGAENVEDVTSEAALAAESRDLLHRLGFDVLGVEAGRPVLRRRPAEVREGMPRLVWTIDTATPVWRPERWGDFHFAHALADALGGLGQKVLVDNREGRTRPSRELDDVVLVLRGLHRPEPRPGQVNLEWVISHPDEVTAEELRGFDRVYAASLSWPATLGERWGVEVHPLLQATDTARFAPDPALFDTGPEALFVGNSRGVFRDTLRLALATGHDVTVVGSEWEALLAEQPHARIAGTHLANDRLSATYASAGVVLNDHWADMRADGFVSNRLMDAAASGARVISDEVAGVDLAALFHGLVREASDETTMRRLLDDPAAHFPGTEARVAAADAVRVEHSFDTRARRLLDDVLDLRRSRG